MAEDFAQPTVDFNKDGILDNKTLQGFRIMLDTFKPRSTTGGADCNGQPQGCH